MFSVRTSGTSWMSSFIPSIMTLSKSLRLREWRVYATESVIGNGTILLIGKVGVILKECLHQCIGRPIDDSFISNIHMYIPTCKVTYDPTTAWNLSCRRRARHVSLYPVPPFSFIPVYCFYIKVVEGWIINFIQT